MKKAHIHVDSNNFFYLWCPLSMCPKKKESRYHLPIARGLIFGIKEAMALFMNKIFALTPLLGDGLMQNGI